MTLNEVSEKLHGKPWSETLRHERNKVLNSDEVRCERRTDLTEKELLKSVKIDLDFHKLFMEDASLGKVGKYFVHRHFLFVDPDSANAAYLAMRNRIETARKAIPDGRYVAKLRVSNIEAAIPQEIGYPVEYVGYECSGPCRGVAAIYRITDGKYKGESIGFIAPILAGIRKYLPDNAVLRANEPVSAGIFTTPRGRTLALIMPIRLYG